MGASRSSFYPGVLAFLAILAVLLWKSGALLQDPDTQWHIAVGGQIWRTGAFPHTDELSFTFHGAPWIAKEWLAQVLLFAVFQLGGWKLVALFTSAVAAGGLAYLFDWLRRRLRMSVAIAFLALAALFASGQFLARPVIFFVPLLIIWTTALIDAQEARRAPPWRLVLLMALWANLHASFAIAFVIAGLIGAEALFGASARERVAVARNWLLFGLVAAAATGAAPYGYEPLRIAYALLRSNEAVRFIDEWQPAGLSPLGLLEIGCFVASLAVLVAARASWFRVLLVFLCGVLMLRYGRFSGLFAIVCVAALARPLTRLIPWTEPEAGGADARLLRIAALGLAAFVAASAIAVQPVPGPGAMPVKAVEAARAAGASGPVFNDYNFGGFLISQGVPTFIDGRTDQLFLNGFISAYYAAIHAEADDEFRRMLDRHGVRWALVGGDSAAVKKLARWPGWRKVYADPAAVVFIRDEQEFETKNADFPERPAASSVRPRADQHLP